MTRFLKQDQLSFSQVYPNNLYCKLYILKIEMTEGSYKIIYIQQMLGISGEIVPILEKLLNIIMTVGPFRRNPF